MQNYNVKQIADMLKIDPETVRRWIREGKLVAEQRSRKKGSLISEKALNDFLKVNPKYTRYMTGFLASNPLTLPLAIGGIVATIIGTIYNQKKVEATSDYIYNYLEKEIEKSSNAIETKKRIIDQLKKEIIEEEDKINKYKYAISNFDLNDIANEINNRINPYK